MKKPEEIKIGMECCEKYMNGAPEEECCHVCNYQYNCAELKMDAIALIRQLEAERDAAVHDLEQSRYCDVCKHLEEKEELCEHYDLPSQCINCSLGKSQFLWRGLCEENGGKEK